MHRIFAQWHLFKTNNCLLACCLLLVSLPARSAASTLATSACKVNQRRCEAIFNEEEDEIEVDEASSKDETAENDEGSLLQVFAATSMSKRHPSQGVLSLSDKKAAVNAHVDMISSPEWWRKLLMAIVFFFLGIAAIVAVSAPEEKLRPTENHTFVRRLVFLVCAIDAADKALLPATFKAISIQMSIGPQELGALMFAQSIAFAVALPIWGSMLRFYTYRDLMSAGCFLWGLATMALCSSTSYQIHFLLRLVIGFSLAVVNPIGQAIICDVVPDNERGWAFGILGGVSAGVAIAVSSWTTSIATENVLGVQGWQWAHAIVGILSFTCGLLVYRCLPSDLSETDDAKDSDSWLLEQYEIMCSVVGKPSVVIMIAQGVTGGVPWNALSFLTFFFQCSGYSDKQAALITACGGIVGILSAPLGGLLGDFFSIACPDSGRSAVAQTSVLLGTICFVCMMYIPYSSHSLALVATFYGVFQLFAGWTPAAALRPMCGSLETDSKRRAQILSYWLALEGLISAMFGAPLVGLLSSHFGYQLDSAHTQIATPGNMIAIREAIVSIGVLCWTMCFLAWIPMYWTYPIDRARSAKEALANRTMEHVLKAEMFR